MDISRVIQCVFKRLDNTRFWAALARNEDRTSIRKSVTLALATTSRFFVFQAGDSHIPMRKEVSRPIVDRVAQTLYRLRASCVMW